MSVQLREIVTLVGPSGCGKSTFLRVVGGLLRPDAGNVRVYGSEVTGPTQDIAIIFQQSTLFPWLTVIANVEFGLRARFSARDEIKERAESWLAAVQLPDRAENWPSELSGGMAQRVALARALAYSPRLLLLDEPFGALDALSRQEMHEVLLELWDRVEMSIVLVTHDIDEAVALSDRVVILSQRPMRITAETPINLPRPRVTGGLRRDGFERERNRVAQLVRSSAIGVTPQEHSVDGSH